MEKWAETENNLYKKIISGKLSKAGKQKALKAWADANSAFWDAEFNTTKQTIPLADSQEFNRRSMRLEKKSADTLLKLKSYTRMLYSDSPPPHSQS